LAGTGRIVTTEPRPGVTIARSAAPVQIVAPPGSPGDVGLARFLRVSASANSGSGRVHGAASAGLFMRDGLARVQSGEEV
jgi:hypothetical protein